MPMTVLLNTRKKGGAIVSLFYNYRFRNNVVTFYSEPWRVDEFNNQGYAKD